MIRFNSGGRIFRIGILWIASLGAASLGVTGSDDMRSTEVSPRGGAHEKSVMDTRAASDPLLTSVIAKLKASDPGAGDSFGTAVAAHGDTIVVGSLEDDDAGTDAGAVYVYRRNEGGRDAWGEVVKITGADTDDGDLFGSSVSVSGELIVVGAPGAVGPGQPSGAVYVFARNESGSNSWGQLAKVTAADTDAGDQFGSAVSIDHGVILVGAPYDSDAHAAAGAAYIFSRNSGGLDAWGQVAKLVASNAGAGHQFGESLAIDRETAVVGAEFADGGALSGGSAYVFARNQGGADGWGELAILQPTDPSDDKGFGHSVGIWTDTVIVGAPGDDDSESDSGAVYLFERNQSGTPESWSQVVKVAASSPVAGAALGSSVAISADIAVAGAPLTDVGASTAQGRSLILRRNLGGADSWAVTDVVEAPVGGDDRLFGGAVAVSWDTIVAGATGDDELIADSGAAHVLEHTGDRLEEGKRVFPTDVALLDYFGTAVAISGDTMVAGSPIDDDTYTDSGSAYIFLRNQGGGDQWQQVAKLVASDPDDYSFFGRAVDIDGDTVIIGCPSNNNSRGSAYIFERNHGGPDAWGEVATFEASDGYAGEHFGTAVSISGDTAVVGASYAYGDPYSKSGAAYVFERNLGGPDSWGQRTRISNPETYLDDFFGNAVDLHGDWAIIGAWADGYYNSGSAYIFARNQGGADLWGLVAKVEHLRTPQREDRCGTSVAIEDDIAFLGCPDYGSGSVFVFQRNAGGTDNWGEIMELSPQETPTSQFGNALDLACGTLVIGNWCDDHAGTESGAAYVFRRNVGGADLWGPLAKLTVTDAQQSDQFGADVAVSCEQVAVGIKKDDQGAQDTGAVAVFDLLPSGVDLGISIDDYTTIGVPGMATPYEITVTNAGPDRASGAIVVADLDPAQFNLTTTTWTCGGGSDEWTICPASGSGQDLVDGVSVTVAVGDSLVIEVEAVIQRLAAAPLVSTVSVAPGTGAEESESGDNSASDSNGLLQLDLGDAPDPSYPTLHTSDGAGHGVVAGFHMGALIDVDADGQPSSGADGDDLDGSDDDDGVSFPTPLLIGQQSTIVVDAAAAGMLDVWVDINGDGDWIDGGEQLYGSYPLLAGSNLLFPVIDVSALAGPSMMRFRFSSTGGLAPTGVASDGEVEDYSVQLLAAPLEPLQAFSATAGDGQATLSWRTPVTDYHSTLVIGRSAIPPTGPSDPDAEVIFDGAQTAGQNHSVVHSGLSNGTTWYYAGYARTSGGALSGSRRVSALPQDMSGSVDWVYSTTASSLAPPAILPNGTYYAVSNDREVHAMDSASGACPSSWSTPSMNGPAQGRPSVVHLTSTTIMGADTVIFVGSQDGSVYAFDANSGAQLWRTTGLGGVETMVQAAPSVMFTDFGAPFNLLVAATWDVAGSAVHGIDVQTGAVLWTYDYDGEGIGVISGQPAIDYSVSPPRVYFTSRELGYGPSVWCLEMSASHATLLWSQGPEDIDAAPTLWNGRVYVGDLYGRVWALDDDTGDYLWSSPWSTSDGPIKEAIWPDPATGRLYFSTNNALHSIVDTGTNAQGYWSPKVWMERPKLVASDGASSDFFGGTGHGGVAVDENVAVIGAMYDDDLGSSSGSAYVFRRPTQQGETWVEVKKILPSEGAANEYFGADLAITGDTVLIGVYGNSHAGTRSGAAYVFQKDVGGVDNWGQVRRIVAGDAQAYDYFGGALDLDVDTAIVGAYGDDDAGSSAGSAYLFERDLGGNDNWGQMKKLLPPSGTGGRFGEAVAIDGLTAVVGARYSDHDGLSNSGAVFVFERDEGGANQWGLVKKVVSSDISAGDEFGTTVAIEGDYLLVGAPGWEYSSSYADIGRVYAFERNVGGANNWGEVGNLGSGHNASARFGGALGISGSMAVAGNGSYDYPIENAGRVTVYQRDGSSGAWNSVVSLTASDGAVSDYFGSSCAISGRTVISGAYGDDDNGGASGSAYIFDSSGPGSIPSPSFPLVVSSKVYLGAGDGRLYQIDATEPSPIPVWLDLGDPAVPKTIGTPGLDTQQGVMIVGSDQGRIFAVEVPLS